MDKRDLKEKLQDVLEYNHLHRLPTLTRDEFISIKEAIDSASPALPNNIEFTNLVERGFIPFK